VHPSNRAFAESTAASISSHAHLTSSRNDLYHFRFVALTSTVVPVHPIARSIANLESIIGQRYPATRLARL
jgi:hypothetical protein